MQVPFIQGMGALALPLSTRATVLVDPTAQVAGEGRRWMPREDLCDSSPHFPCLGDHVAGCLRGTQPGL